MSTLWEGRAQEGAVSGRAGPRGAAPAHTGNTHARGRGRHPEVSCWQRLRPPPGAKVREGRTAPLSYLPAQARSSGSRAWCIWRAEAQRALIDDRGVSGKRHRQTGSPELCRVAHLRRAPLPLIHPRVLGAAQTRAGLVSLELAKRFLGPRLLLRRRSLTDQGQPGLQLLGLWLLRLPRGVL